MSAKLVDALEEIAEGGDIYTACGMVEIARAALAQAEPAQEQPRDALQQALEALDRLDDYIARVNGDDRGSCADINTVRAALKGHA